jgi:hypothetical protein
MSAAVAVLRARRRQEHIETWGRYFRATRPKVYRGLGWIFRAAVRANRCGRQRR